MKDCHSPVVAETSVPKKILALLIAAAREIFDEAAYARFLERKGLANSRASYAAFLREQHTAKCRTPRCC